MPKQTSKKPKNKEIRKFPHLTSQIRGRIIKEQPITFMDKDYDKEFHIIIYEDDFYSVIGKSKDNLLSCLLHEDDLTDEMKKHIEKASRYRLLKP